jgi:hypothetical protein
MCAQCAAGAGAAIASVGGIAGLRAWLATRGLAPAVLRAATALLLVAAVLAAGLLA